MGLVQPSAETRRGLPPAASETRLSLLSNGLVQTIRGPYRCIVLEMSPGGAQLSFNNGQPLVSVGEPVTLMTTTGMFRGEIVAVREDVSTVRFHHA